MSALDGAPWTMFRVAVIGGGPAGLGVAAGLAQLGHTVDVFERLDSPVNRGTVNRDRSYPVVTNVRGVRALQTLGLDGAALRACLLPFTPFLPLEAFVGSRDDLVLGMLEQIRVSESQWSGRLRIHFGVRVEGLDLERKELGFHPALGLDSKFDLICACDGKWSRVRQLAVDQDPALIVKVFEDSGERLYKSISVANPDAIGGFPHGEMFYLPGGGVVARMPSGGAVGIVPLWSSDDGAGQGQLRRMGLDSVFPYLSADEEEAFDRRPVCSDDGGVHSKSLIAGRTVALIGDSATSYQDGAGGRQGANHALDMAVAFVDAAKAGGSVSDVLERYNESRLPDEMAYGEGRIGFETDTRPYRELDLKEPWEKGKMKGKGKGKEKGKGKDKGKGKGKGQARTGDQDLFLLPCSARCKSSTDSFCTGS